QMSIRDRNNDLLRQKIQSLVLLELNNEKPIGQRSRDLSQASLGLIPNENDVILFITNMFLTNPSDERWNDMIHCSHHPGGIAIEVRNAHAPLTLGQAKDKLRRD
ncbi:hypothetical protein, partial [Acinetobacter baumannii]|uniref:hypothetical protein n=1 Tax=Acinetobacter baumannii TaxID=470 RepID=UPI0021019036